MCGRNKETLDKTCREVGELASSGQCVIAHLADVSKYEDVQDLVQTAEKTFNQIHVLVNNAGIYGPLGLAEEVDWDDWVQAIGINLLGSVQMCRAVLRHFKNQRYGKIIQLSGGGATAPLPRFSAYATSKAAIVRYAETLAEEVHEYGIDVNAIAPGALNTRLLDEVLEAGPQKVGVAFYERAVQQQEQGGSPEKRAADLAIYLGSEQSDGISGKIISAVWDPWEDFEKYTQDLKTDVYTLRRIVPEDRNMGWGS